MSQNNPYATPAVTSPAPPVVNDRDRLKRIASAQRNVMIVILLYVCLLPINIGLSSLGPNVPWAEVALPIIIFIIFGLGVVSMYRLASIIRGPGIAVIHALGLFVPILGLLLLLSNSGKATRELQQAGIKVGLLGANPKSI